MVVPAVLGGALLVVFVILVAVLARTSHSRRGHHSGADGSIAMYGGSGDGCEGGSASDGGGADGGGGGGGGD